MENPLNKEEYAKNIYLIKHKLGELKRVPFTSYFEWRIGPFGIKMWTGRFGDYESEPPQYLTLCSEIDVQIYEILRENNKECERFVNLQADPRFCNYKPIQYDVIKTPNGEINRSDGNDMPITYVCELIRYLYRLANLTAFL